VEPRPLHMKEEKVTKRVSNITREIALHSENLLHTPLVNTS